MRIIPLKVLRRLLGRKNVSEKWLNLLLKTKKV
jgi:hypothetical protein